MMVAVITIYNRSLRITTGPSLRITASKVDFTELQVEFDHEALAIKARNEANRTQEDNEQGDIDR